MKEKKAVVLIMELQELCGLQVDKAEAKKAWRLLSPQGKKNLAKLHTGASQR